MKERRSLALGLFFFASISMMAIPRSETDALLKAQQFYTAHLQGKLRNSVELKLVYTDEPVASKGKETPGFYVFNAGIDEGFVLVSGNDAVRTILGYSDKGQFPTENLPENLKSWLSFYHQEIQYASKLGTAYLESSVGNSNTSVAPLIKSKWNQFEPYNLFCPYHPDYRERTVTGCTATSMAQIMNYHQWPTKGTGVHTDSLTFDSTRIGLTANFGETTYPWNDMLDIYNGTSTPAQDTAVALLSYHCGIAANMMYNVASVGGSGAYVENAGLGMIQHFGYDADMQIALRWFFKPDDWEALLRKELDASRPMLYAGSSPTGSHAFVCDGYDSNGYFHFNWGWGGLYDGYFSTTTMNPKYPNDKSSINGFSYFQYCLFGIQKADNKNNPFYQLYMTGAPIKSSKTFLPAVNTDHFNIDFGYANFGITTFRGSIGAGLYQNGTFLKCLDATPSVWLERPYGDSLFHSKNLSLAGMANGNYQLCAVYQPKDSSNWSKIFTYSTISNNLNITIQGNSATFSTPELKPNLILTDPIQVNGSFYQNKKCTFRVPLKNTGYDFYSNLTMHLYSETNQKNCQDLDASIALIKKDESQTVEIKGNLKLNPGTYLAYLQYDSTNFQSTESYKKIGSPFQITILPESGNPLLTIEKSIQLEGGDTLYVKKAFTLTSDIKNVGGFFSDEIRGYVFPEKPGTMLSIVGTQNLELDSTQTKKVQITGSIDLIPGKYRLIMYYLLNNALKRPYSANLADKTEYAVLPFSLLAETNVSERTTPPWRLASNPVGEMLELITDETVLLAGIYDLSGRLLMQFSQTKKMAVGNLGKGMYLLRVTTEKGFHTERFIKK